jgi:hypothetical protein
VKIYAGITRVDLHREQFRPGSGVRVII